MRLHFKISTSIFLLILAFNVEWVRADALKELESSESFKTVMGGRDREEWKKDDTNFSKLFLGADRAAKTLAGWLGNPKKYFKRHSVKGEGGTGYIGSEIELSSLESLAKIHVVFLVPKPKKVAHVQLQLIPGFAVHEPPKLKVKSEEKIIIQKFNGVLYTQESGACSLLIKMPRASILNLETNSCDAKEDLIRLANLFDLNRAAKKLLS